VQILWISFEGQDRVAEVVATYLNGAQDDLRLMA
jgi:hypothetical protein